MKLLLTAVSIVLLLILAAIDAPAQSGLGPFGYFLKQPKPIHLTEALQKLVPSKCPVRNIQDTKLSSTGEQIIICGPEAPEEGPTHVIVTDGHTLALKDIDVDELFSESGGAYQFVSATEVVNKSNRHAYLVAFLSAGDGSGSCLFAIGYSGDKYKVLLHRSVTQGRIVFHRDKDSIEIWDSAEGACPRGNDCVWCLHPYRIEKYLWVADEFRLQHTITTKHCFSPGSIVSQSITVENRLHQESSPAGATQTR